MAFLLEEDRIVPFGYSEKFGINNLPMPVHISSDGLGDLDGLKLGKFFTRAFTTKKIRKGLRKVVKKVPRVIGAAGVGFLMGGPVGMIAAGGTAAFSGQKKGRKWYQNFLKGGVKFGASIGGATGATLQMTGMGAKFGLSSGYGGKLTQFARGKYTKFLSPVKKVSTGSRLTKAITSVGKTVNTGSKVMKVASLVKGQVAAPPAEEVVSQVPESNWYGNLTEAGGEALKYYTQVQRARAAEEASQLAIPQVGSSWDLTYPPGSESVVPGQSMAAPQFYPGEAGAVTPIYEGPEPGMVKQAGPFLPATMMPKQLDTKTILTYGGMGLILYLLLNKRGGLL